MKQKNIAGQILHQWSSPAGTFCEFYSTPPLAKIGSEPDFMQLIQPAMNTVGQNIGPDSGVPTCPTFQFLAHFWQVLVMSRNGQTKNTAGLYGHFHPEK